jgi:ribonuclease R
VAKGRSKPRRAAPIPTKDAVLQYLRESPKPVGRRELVRAFGIKGADQRAEFNRLLKELSSEGRVERQRGRRLARPGTLPEVTVVEVTGTDPDGELLARPVVWHGEGAPPTIYVAPERHGTPAIGVGARLLARLRRTPDGTYEATVVRVIAGRPHEVLGVIERLAQGARVKSTDRRQKGELFIAEADLRGTRSGDLVKVEVLPVRVRGAQRAKVVARIGHTEDPGAISLIAIHDHDIPMEFPRAALDQAAGARPCRLGDRADLRTIPLVTIDGPDARDFDDAVWAEPDRDPKNTGGWHLVVAIADVAHYVTPGSALDRTAFERGNSVYFPDRVVPMLPEALSNELCSLKPDEDRACMAVHLWIDAHGNARGHRFERALMRSAARLTYEQVQRAQDGAPDDLTGPLKEPVIAPLYGAFRSLAAARERRGTLELELPEQRVTLDERGRITGIVARPRYDSHRLIEEFMIAANVAAAESLERAGQPAMYRIHDRPDAEKVESLREFLEGMGYRLAKGQVILPRHFTGLLKQARERGHEHLVSELVLRSQAQAVYAPENIGHFGLALRRYCHFTSPIRRYADILVHRGLISGLGFGGGGLSPEEAARFDEIGEHISATERRAATAERDARDRYVVAFLEERVGAVFEGRITGVTRFGLFVRLPETGADGLVPIRSLADDYYIHDERRHCLAGRRHGRRYTLGDAATVRLVEAEAVTGGLLFEIIGHEPVHARGATPGKPRPRAEGRPAKRPGAERKPLKKKKSTRSGARRSRRGS